MKGKVRGKREDGCEGVDKGSGERKDGCACELMIGGCFEQHVEMLYLYPTDISPFNPFIPLRSHPFLSSYFFLSSFFLTLPW